MTSGSIPWFFIFVLVQRLIFHQLRCLELIFTVNCKLSSLPMSLGTRAAHTSNGSTYTVSTILRGLPAPFKYTSPLCRSQFVAKSRVACQETGSGRTLLIAPRLWIFSRKPPTETKESSLPTKTKKTAVQNAATLDIFVLYS